MWPRSRVRAEEVLRIGKYAVERWHTVDGALTLASSHALPQDTLQHPQRLIEALPALYASAPRTPTTLVFESVWLPVMAIDPGPVLLRSDQVDALVRHRFGLYHSGSANPVASWELRLEHRAGSRCAVVYGMSPTLKQVFVSAGRAAGIEWAAMTPSMAWGMERLHISKRWPRNAGWFLWPEQDRTLVARFESKQVVGLNAGAAPAGDEASLKRLVDVESARLGFLAAAPVAAARWTPVPRAASLGEEFAWLDLRIQGGSSTGARDLTASANVFA